MAFWPQASCAEPEMEKDGRWGEAGCGGGLVLTEILQCEGVKEGQVETGNRRKLKAI